MERINIEEILKKYDVSHFSSKHAKIKGTEDWKLIQAIKEIVDTVVDKCAAKALIDTVNLGASEFQTVVDEESILNVKNLVDYE